MKSAFLAAAIGLMAASGAAAAPVGSDLAPPIGTPAALSAVLDVDTPVHTPVVPFPVAGISYGKFDISINFTGSVSAAQAAAFSTAESFWESAVTGYRTPMLGSLLPSLNITASIRPIDNVGGTLGYAGATHFWDTLEFDTPSAGVMIFDEADVNSLLAADMFDDVVLHEMAHVMGFSNFLWQRNGAVDSDIDTQYRGPVGLAAYRQEFDPSASFIPIEDGGGPGAAYSHWDEELFGNYLALNGNLQNPELMTAFLDVFPPSVSQTTIASFGDLGYAVQLPDMTPPLPAATLVPLPGALPLLLGCVGVFALVSRRSRRACA